LKEIMIATISSTSKRGSSGGEDTHAMSNDDTNDKVKPQQQCENESNQAVTHRFLKQVIVRTRPVAPVLRYIPRSHHKDG